MNIDLEVAQNYGKALFEAARDQNAIEQVWRDGQEIIRVAGEVPDLVLVLRGPQLSADQKMELVRKLVAGKVHPLLLNFLLLMFKRRRAGIFEAALDHFRHLAEQAQGISHGRVTTAIPLNDGEKADMQAALQTYTNLTLTLDYHTDPSIVGGVVFKSGDLLIDDSLKGQLARLGERLNHVPIN